MRFSSMPSEQQEKGETDLFLMFLMGHSLVFLRAIMLNFMCVREMPFYFREGSSSLLRRKRRREGI